MIDLTKPVAALMKQDATLTEPEALVVAIEEIAAIQDHLELTSREAYDLFMYDLAA